MPQGATVLDFAIEEKHMKGLRCSAALINQQIAPLYHKLSHGDQVELILNNVPEPKLEWLDFVITPKAIRTLKKVLKKAHESIQVKGENMLKNILNKLGLHLNKTNIELVKELFDEKTVAKLYYKIGTKKIKLKELLEVLEKFVKRIEEKSLPNVKNTNGVNVEPQAMQSSIVVSNENTLNYTLAQCCDPIFGEEIFGVVGLHQKTTIHRIDCVNAIFILTHQGDKIVSATWKEQKGMGELDFRMCILSQDKNIRKKIIVFLQEKCHIAFAIFKKQKDFVKGSLALR